MVCLSVLDDSLTSWGFTAGAGWLAECYEPLRRLGVGLWPCGAGLGQPVTLCY